MPRHARARLNATVDCSACTNGRGCITACKTIGHMHGKCAFPGSRDPGRCCACWSAPAPELVDTEASFCDPLIKAEADANAASPATAKMRESRRTKTFRTLFWSFEVCGGLTNQRISIIHGLMASYLMRATAILPRLNPNGVQRPGSGYAEVRTNLVPFDRYYDREALVAGLEPLGMRIANLANEERFHTGAWPQRRKMATTLHVRNQHHPASWYTRVARDHVADGNSTAVLVGDCAFFSLQMQQDPDLGKLFWQIDSALVFAHWIQEKANRIVTSITRASRALGVLDGSFNALHVRSEPDWKQHCQKWEDVAAERDNCMTNTERLPRIFAIEGVSPSKPVYVAGEFTATSLERTSSLSALAASSYRLHTKDSLDPLFNNASDHLDRDLLAAIDFAVVKSAQTFIGNSVSTFSAMILLWRQKERAASHLSCNDFKEEQQRRARNRITHPCRLDAFHYNGGDIPLQSVLFGEASSGALPQRGLKWIFTVTSAGVDYAEATRIAVASALERTSLTPICIWAGEENELSNWLISKGVRVVHHMPEWKDRLLHAMHRARELGHAAKSPLYMSSERMLGTWLRLDAATLGFVDRYVLYTDVDVIFEQDISVQDFGSPLPRYFTLGTEANANMCGVLLDTTESSSMFSSISSMLFGSSSQGPPRYAKVGNAGVMLMNMEGLRRTHAQFIRWVFSTTNLGKGLFFDEYGPGDQGAFNSKRHAHSNRGVTVLQANPPSLSRSRILRGQVCSAPLAAVQLEAVLGLQCWCQTDPLPRAQASRLHVSSARHSAKLLRRQPGVRGPVDTMHGDRRTLPSTVGENLHLGKRML